jgi:hypothetical protein
MGLALVRELGGRGDLDAVDRHRAIASDGDDRAVEKGPGRVQTSHLGNGCGAAFSVSAWAIEKKRSPAPIAKASTRHTYFIARLTMIKNSKFSVVVSAK